jgi:hypothetical protein
MEVLIDISLVDLGEEESKFSQHILGPVLEYG